MKKLGLILLALTFVSSSFAGIKLGVRGGISSSTIKINSDPFTYNSKKYFISNGDAKVGFHFGLMSQVSLLGFYIQPEMLLSSIRNDYKIQINDGSSNTIDQFKSAYQNSVRLDIPLTMGFKTGALRIGAGPVLSKVLSSTSDLKDEVKGIADEDFSSFTWGFQAGVGFDLGKLAFDLRWEGSISTLGSGLQKVGVAEDVKFDTRPRQLIFSVGYYF